MMDLFGEIMVVLLLSFSPVVYSTTYPGDYEILNEFRKGLSNSELLNWPNNGNDPCGPPSWPHITCSDAHVTGIQVQGLGLEGSLPSNFNQLSMLTNLTLQRNNFTGPLPSFGGLSNLQAVYLDSNQFNSIPVDFFDGLINLQIMSMDLNPLNKSNGWMLPTALGSATQLLNFSCANCSLVGPLPDVFGNLSSLLLLRLPNNVLSGEVPKSMKSLTNLRSLVLTNQNDSGLIGTINFLPFMTSLSVVRLQGNSFNGTIPANISLCTSLTELALSNNKLTGTVPAASLRKLKQLQKLKLDDNNFLGPIPDLPIANFSYGTNTFCQSKPGVPCDPVVEALLDFLAGVGFPANLAASWTMNNPCVGLWLGITCMNGTVNVVNLQNQNLTGTISPSLGKLDSLVDIRLGGNHLVGQVPENLTKLMSLKIINLTGNNLSPPLPKFNASSVTVLADNNPLLDAYKPKSGGSKNSSRPSMDESGGSNSNRNKLRLKKIAVASSTSIAAAILVFMLVCCSLVYWRRKKNQASGLQNQSSVLVHPKDLSENKSKVSVTSDANLSISSSCDTSYTDSVSMSISGQVLREVTGNFAPENELGRGGFGVVYKGELADGTKLAVKRMEASVVRSTVMDQFSSEISVLSKVRHRNLVSLLGYSAEGNERLLVYEYLSKGALSKLLFQWKDLNLEPLSWTKRLSIALDVARGVEYLHNLAHRSFIHRDLKSSNILLDDEYRAKIADFGLVKLAPDGKNSVATKLAGTFGYLAPEYAVTGKVTTKVDVFSFGVVLMELVTGLPALDEDRPEETRHLASWFPHIVSNKEKLMAAIDPSLDVTEDTFESILVVAQLAGHCTTREPLRRPNMSHAVNVLASLSDKWMPA